jgi:hypothetical protein
MEGEINSGSPEAPVTAGRPPPTRRRRSRAASDGSAAPAERSEPGQPSLRAYRDALTPLPLSQLSGQSGISGPSAGAVPSSGVASAKYPGAPSGFVQAMGRSPHAVGPLGGAIDASMYAATTPTFGVYGGGYIGSGGVLLSPTLLAAAAAAARSNSSSPHRPVADASSPTLIMAGKHKLNPGRVVAGVPVHPGSYAITPNLTSNGGEATVTGPDTPSGASFWIDDSNFDTSNYIYAAVSNPYGYYTGELTSAAATTPYAGVSMSPLHGASGITVSSPYRSLLPGPPHSSTAWPTSQPSNGPQTNLDSGKDQRRASGDHRPELGLFPQTSAPDRKLISAWNRAHRREKLERERALKRVHDETLTRETDQAAAQPRHESGEHRKIPSEAGPIGISESPEEVSENTSAQQGTRSTSERSREDYGPGRTASAAQISCTTWHLEHAPLNRGQSNGHGTDGGLSNAREARAQRNREAARRSRLKVKRMITDLEQQNANLAAVVQARDQEIEHLRRENAQLREQLSKPRRESTRKAPSGGEDPACVGGSANMPKTESPREQQPTTSEQGVRSVQESATATRVLGETALATSVEQETLQLADTEAHPAITSDAGVIPMVRETLPILSPLPNAHP